VRQWVLSLPKRLRPFLPRDPALAGAVLRILCDAIRAFLLKHSPTAPAEAQPGAVSFLHRFGSALNPHFHFHLVVLDGLFSADADGSVHFHEASQPGTRAIQRLQQMVRRRVLRLYRRREILDESTVANVLTWQAAGGFSIDASVRISGSDRAGRELLRYCARPPFALERLRIERVHSARSAGAGIAGTGDIIRHVLYQPSRSTPEGRTLLVLSPLEFLTALARLIPPPRVHRHRYHGVLAPNAGLRERVTALATAAEPDTPRQGRPENDEPATPDHRAACSRWARLIARIYAAFPLSCPDCGAEMRILAFLTDPFTVAGILRHLALPHTPGLPKARTHEEHSRGGQRSVRVNRLVELNAQLGEGIHPSPAVSVEPSA
jgi:hypothetical protein